MTKSRHLYAPRQAWSAAQHAEFVRRYPHEPTAALATALGRSVRSLYARAKTYDVRKSAAYLASPAACRLRKGDRAGEPHRFPKGHVPANKGLRRPGWCRGRMRETQFKPGQRQGKAAAHWMPIGSTRLKDGYILRKVADVMNVPYTVNWKLEQRLVWEGAYGPVPAGWAVAFLNGNRQDTRLDNLTLIPRRALMARNTVHNLPKPIAQTVQLLGALNRQIRKRSHGEKQNH